MEGFTLFGWDFSTFFTPQLLAILLRAGILLFIGLPLAFMLSRWTTKYITKRLSAQQGMISGKIVKYVAILVVVFSLLKEFGFELTHIFAAAGIAGIAIGFASQTSISNVISGLFLIAERPFVVDDVISVGGTTGQVLSIDILSIKLRTFDNRFVRIPNESIIKSEVINITHFPIRRVEVRLGVAYKEDVVRVKNVLQDLANKNPLCLQEPEPVIIFDGFGNSSLDFFFGVWAAKTDFLKLKNSIQEDIKKRFDEEGIEIPYPHTSIYAGSVTDPFPIRIVNDAPAAKEG